MNGSMFNGFTGRSSPPTTMSSSGVVVTDADIEALDARMDQLHADFLRDTRIREDAKRAKIDAVQKRAAGIYPLSEEAGRGKPSISSFVLVCDKIIEYIRLYEQRMSYGNIPLYSLCFIALPPTVNNINRYEGSFQCECDQ
jgi:hypothetical protein